MNKDIVKGLLISFGIFIVATTLVVLLIFSVKGEAGFGVALIISNPFGALYLAAPFLVLNLIVLKFIKIRDIRLGMKLGFLLALIYLGYTLLIYWKMASHFDKINQAKEDANMAVQQSSADDCAKIGDMTGIPSLEFDRANCFQAVAQETKDVEICDRIDDKYIYIKKDCYTYLADDLGRIGYCDKISDRIFKDECIKIVAVKLQNQSYCNEIVTDFLRMECVKYTDIK